MSDSDEENYAIFGVPLDPLDEGIYKQHELSYKLSYKYFYYIKILQKTSQGKNLLQLKISMLMMLKVDVGFMEHLQVDFQQDISILLALAMVGDHSSSNHLEATKQIILLNDRRILWMKKIQVFLGSLLKGFELPVIMLIMEKEERKEKE
jgi:hypothetical protein